jgi:hypothetical protein
MTQDRACVSGYPGSIFSAKNPDFGPYRTHDLFFWAEDTGLLHIDAPSGIDADWEPPGRKCLKTVRNRQ